MRKNVLWQTGDRHQHCTFILDATAGSDFADHIQDFNVDDDVLRLQSVSSPEDVRYDATTGELLVNDTLVAKLSPNLNIGNDHFELF